MPLFVLKQPETPQFINTHSVGLRELEATFYFGGELSPRYEVLGCSYFLALCALGMGSDGFQEFQERVPSKELPSKEPCVDRAS